MPKIEIEKEIIPFKTISQVADLIGVETHVLRFWEKEFSQIKPQRSNGRRYYSQDAIEIILQIRSLLYEQGFTIEGAKKHLKQINAKITIVDNQSILEKLRNLEKILLS